MQKTFVCLLATLIGAAPALSASITSSSEPLDAGGLLDTILSILTPSSAEPMATPLAMATMAPATELSRRQSSTQCTTGTLSCCQSTQSHSSSDNSTIGGVLGVTASDVLGLVGLDCSPISVVATGGSTSCNNEPLCCQQESAQTISFNCVPVNVDV